MLRNVLAFVYRNPQTGVELTLDPRDVTIVWPNDIDATGECCCNGCIGQGLCDLDLGQSAVDDAP